MISKIIERNKKIFLRYNAFRRQIFQELSPKECETISYLIPWLLSVNHPACPGYIGDLRKPFKVFNIDNDLEIRKREAVFKRRFGIRKTGPLLKTKGDYCLIQGIYTIGSAGTVSQTSLSDCDIWICYDRKDFDQTSWRQLNQKVNLIKDWMDIHLKMPLFFFICEVADIRAGHFGSVDSESSGSAQRNILKEEFYRTFMVICGKIPLWWLCADGNDSVDYDKALAAVQDHTFGTYDIIDLGNLESIRSYEYFGAALWQLNKSLTSPLKSIIKMFLLKMLLDTSQERLICHQFRQKVMECQNHDHFPDPSVFTMIAILNYYDQKNRKILSFLKESFYLRCEIRPSDRNHSLKKKLVDELFAAFPLHVQTRIRLSKFQSWPLKDQIRFGKQIFKLLLQVYKEIAADHAGVSSKVDELDLTILGRKISVCYQVKNHKVTVLQKPTSNLNAAGINLKLEDGVWHVFCGGDREMPLVSNEDLIFNIAFLVWSNLFAPVNISMEPNPSAVTIQEIINLGSRIRSFFGTFESQEIEYSQYFQKEAIAKLLVAVSFERSPWEKDINDFGVVYKNNWGELFVRRFNSPVKLEAFLRKTRQEIGRFETAYYVQRNSTYYEKIIERTKKIFLASAIR